MGVWAYIAAPESGKSTLMRRHVYEVPLPVRAFLIMDRGKARDGRGWDGPVYRSADELRRSPTIPRWCVFRGCSGCEVAELAIDLGHCAFVDEEVHKTLTERPWKAWDRTTEKGRAGHPLHAILHEGRHLENAIGEDCEVHALIATHRPAGLPADFSSMLTGVYLGRLRGYTDADRVHRDGWLPGAGSAREVREILERRQVGEFSLYP